MNVLILNGGPADARGALCRDIAETVESESRARGWIATAFDLDRLIIKPCLGCFSCWLKHPGTCVLKDDQEEVLSAWVPGDLHFWITPVTFGGFGSALKKSLDRTIPHILPFFTRVGGEVHHPQRYERRRRFLALGTLPAPDAEAERIFHGLIRRNALNLGSVATESGVFFEGTGKEALSGRVHELMADVGEEG
jgi:multimeric flavodoxin WrbA